MAARSAAMPKQPKTVDSAHIEVLPQGYDAQRAKVLGPNPLVGIDPITGAAPQSGLEKEGDLDKEAK
jgi:hypothetical protein